MSELSRVAPDAAVPIRPPWSTEPVVEMKHVTISYAQSAPVLRDVNLSLEEGEILLVVGRTGSGKSTLLNAMTGAMPHSTGGTLEGHVTIVGRDTRNFPPRLLADAVGTVGQDPRATFVTDTVEEELAYGMEQIGLPPAVMRRRVEKIMDLLGIAELRDLPLRTLSGGEQQRVAMGAVLTSNPALIVMDEPTSALDPNAADNVLSIIQHLAHEMGTTVVLAEHRIERVLQYVDRVAHVDATGAVHVGSPAEIMQYAEVAPPVVELGRWADWSPLPLSVRDARRAGVSLRRQLHTAADSRPEPGRETTGEVLLNAHSVSVEFPGIRAVHNVDLQLRAGEVTALMGRNGCGKSTLLWALQGTGKRTAGMVQVRGGVDPSTVKPAQRRQEVGLVPQFPSDLLYRATIGEELQVSDQEAGVPEGSTREILQRIAPGITHDIHPGDLSEGQRLSVALAIQLAAQPRVLLCDEPTRGLDYGGKEALAASVKHLRDLGHAVVIATHDVEFAALCADRVVEMARGEIVAQGPAREILASSLAYAPQVAKVTAGLHHDSQWLTVSDVRNALETR